jgi:hypothetical protein
MATPSPPSAPMEVSFGDTIAQMDIGLKIFLGGGIIGFLAMIYSLVNMITAAFSPEGWDFSEAAETGQHACKGLTAVEQRKEMTSAPGEEEPESAPAAQEKSEPKKPAGPAMTFASKKDLLESSGDKRKKEKDKEKDKRKDKGVGAAPASADPVYLAEESDEIDAKEEKPLCGRSKSDSSCVKGEKPLCKRSSSNLSHSSIFSSSSSSSKDREKDKDRSRSRRKSEGGLSRHAEVPSDEEVEPVDPPPKKGRTRLTFQVRSCICVSSW